MKKTNNRLLDFILEFKKKEEIVENQIESIDYQDIITKALSEIYTQPEQKEFIHKTIEIPIPLPGKRYSKLRNLSIESIMMKFHLYDTKLRKGYNFRNTTLKRGDPISVLDKSFILDLPTIYRLPLQFAINNMGNIPFFAKSDIFTLPQEYIKIKS